jgi:hypothetical protein
MGIDLQLGPYSDAGRAEPPCEHVPNHVASIALPNDHEVTVGIGGDSGVAVASRRVGADLELRSELDRDLAGAGRARETNADRGQCESEPCARLFQRVLSLVDGPAKARLCYYAMKRRCR